MVVAADNLLVVVAVDRNLAGEAADHIHAEKAADGILAGAVGRTLVDGHRVVAHNLAETAVGDSSCADHDLAVVADHSPVVRSAAAHILLVTAEEDIPFAGHTQQHLHTAPPELHTDSGLHQDPENFSHLFDHKTSQ